jgi:hypothetical protein
MEMWIGTGVVKGDICFVNGTKKHVEDISVDAVSGSKFCSVSF